MEGLQTELQDISENVTVFWVKHKDDMKDLYPLKNDQSPFIPKALIPFWKIVKLCSSHLPVSLLEI